MGCFFECFGSYKHRRRRRQKHKAQRNGSCNSVLQSTVSLVQDHSVEPISSVSEISDKAEDQVSISIHRKVTFDLNVKAYEHVSLKESEDFSQEKEDNGKRKEKEDNSVKQTQSQSSSEDHLITSLESYPRNHRYQSCRDSEDELDYKETDMEDDDDDDDDNDEMDEDDHELDYNDVHVDDGRIVDLRFRIPVDKVVTDEIDSSVVITRLPERVPKSSNNARDRSNHVHPMLNPVENLTQWKAVKAKGAPTLRQQEENLGLDQESRTPCTIEPSFKELSFSFKEKSDQLRKSNEEIAVDASLSNWLGLSESTPTNKPSTTGLDTTASEESTLKGSNPLRSFEDRPILGALTVEELKQLSTSSYLSRRSPSHSPDEMPIIGTVGTYWNHSDYVKASGVASSFKGLPNTTSKVQRGKESEMAFVPI